MELDYNTRDEKGNDFIKKVKIKEFPVEKHDFECPICHQCKSDGCRTKKIVSSKFTDWAYISDWVCIECSKLFSLYPYSYIVDPDGIRLLNVRQLCTELCKGQNVPFRFCISVSQKKHLFYRSTINYSNERFAVNLETETIYTTPSRMKYLFDFVELLQTLGASKKAMVDCEIPFPVLQKTSFQALEILRHELQTSREIQIPLYCGQKRTISEEEAICYLNLILSQN